MCLDSPLLVRFCNQFRHSKRTKTSSPQTHAQNISRRSRSPNRGSIKVMKRKCCFLIVFWVQELLRVHKKMLLGKIVTGWWVAGRRCSFSRSVPLILLINRSYAVKRLFFLSLFDSWFLLFSTHLLAFILTKSYLKSHIDKNVMLAFWPLQEIGVDETFIRRANVFIRAEIGIHLSVRPLFSDHTPRDCSGFVLQCNFGGNATSFSTNVVICNASPRIHQS